MPKTATCSRSYRRSSGCRPYCTGMARPEQAAWEKRKRPPTLTLAAQRKRRLIVHMNVKGRREPAAGAAGAGKGETCPHTCSTPSNIAAVRTRQMDCSPPMRSEEDNTGLAGSRTAPSRCGMTIAVLLRRHQTDRLKAGNCHSRMELVKTISQKFPRVVREWATPDGNMTARRLSGGFRNRLVEMTSQIGQDLWPQPA